MLNEVDGSGKGSREEDSALPLTKRKQVRVVEDDAEQFQTVGHSSSPTLEAGDGNDDNNGKDNDDEYDAEEAVSPNKLLAPHSPTQEEIDDRKTQEKRILFQLR